MTTFMNPTLSKDLAERLEQTIPLLFGRQKDAACDLIAAAKRYGRVTDKQADYMEALIRQPTAPQVPRPTANIGDMKAVIDLFDDVASRGLRYPSVVLRDETEGDVKLYVMGASSKDAGCISVQTNDGFPASKWFGKVRRDGSFEMSTRHAPSRTLIALLERFAMDPQNTAAEHGRLTGLCCFCHRPLKDARSTDVGYGPVCAKRWGMAW